MEKKLLSEYSNLELKYYFPGHIFGMKKEGFAGEISL
jgi:hypothetical protein